MKKLFDFKNPDYRKRFVVMFVGIIIMGLGSALFRLSLTGNDPSSALALGLRDYVGQPLSVTLVMTGAAYFVFEIIWGRRYIGIGTFVNWFGVGYFSDIWTNFLSGWIEIDDVWTQKIPLMFIGVLVLSLSVSLYQTADVGIAPYDSLALMIDAHVPIPYFWCRIFVDTSFMVMAYLIGGLIGLGTIMCAFGLGPFISFFNRTVSERILPPEKEN